MRRSRLAPGVLGVAALTAGALVPPGQSTFAGDRTQPDGTGRHAIIGPSSFKPRFIDWGPTRFVDDDHEAD